MAQEGGRRQQLGVDDRDRAVDGGRDDVDVGVIALIGRHRGVARVPRGGGVEHGHVIGAVPMRLQRAAQPRDGVGGAGRHGDTVRVGGDRLKAAKLRRAREERQPLVLLPEVVGRLLVHRQQVLDVLVDDGGGRRLRGGVELVEGQEHGQALERRAV